eukprot:TRINITY_DN17863_c0_g1_i1.p1 TRINITY_DN17863_c0_g1~~TRINITY_DN17863_c0_g1_i1.p1  ORF type:complete len:257 (+),score=10.08 TRINITY_DN17863_c0_g1_i1:49-771(+)
MGDIQEIKPAELDMYQNEARLGSEEQPITSDQNVGPTMPPSRKTQRTSEHTENNVSSTPNRTRSKGSPSKKIKAEADWRVSNSQDTTQMQPFVASKTTDWKHVLYNLLVENHNALHPKDTLLLPIEVLVNGKWRPGFRINPELQPKIAFADLYAIHIRKEPIDELSKDCPFVQDLYKFYWRSSHQLTSKYFKKVGAWMFVYEGRHLFIPGEKLDVAKARIKEIETKQRRKKKEDDSDENV